MQTPIPYYDYKMAPHARTERSYRSTLCCLPGKQVLVYFQGTKVFLNDLEAHKIRIFAAHHAPVTAVAVHPLGGYVASVDKSGSLKLWSPTHETMMVDQEYSCDGEVSALEFNAEGRKLLIGCASGKNSLLVLDPELKTTSPMPAGSQVTCIAHKPQRPFACVSCSADGQISAFSFNFKPSKSGRLPVFPCACSYSPDGKFVLVGGMDGQVTVVDAKELTTVQKQQIHAGAIYQMRVIDGDLITCSGDASVKRWTVGADGVLALRGEARFEKYQKDYTFNIVGMCYVEPLKKLVI